MVKMHSMFFVFKRSLTFDIGMHGYLLAMHGGYQYKNMILRVENVVNIFNLPIVYYINT